MRASAATPPRTALNRVSEVLADKPRVVIVEFGGNDGLRGLPIETTRANLEQMIVALQEVGSYRGAGGDDAAAELRAGLHSPFEQVYQDLAAKYKLVRIPFLLEGVATDRSLMQRDGIHPTGQGNEMVAETVMRYLRPVLSAALRRRLRRFGGGCAVAFQAQGAEIGQVAFAAAFHHGNNVVGIPEALSRSRGKPQSVKLSAARRRADASDAARRPGNRRRKRRRLRDRAPGPFREDSRDRCADAILRRTNPNKK